MRVTCAFALAILLAGSAAEARGARVASPIAVRRVSAGDPFPRGCPGHPRPTSGLNAEPALALDPTDPRHLVVTWLTGAYGDDADYGVAAGVSRDGGRTFATSVLPGLSDCTGNSSFTSVANDTVAMGGRGLVYVATQAYQESAHAAPGRIEVSASRDGGRSWHRPVVVSAGLGLLNEDHPALVVDPHHPEHALLDYVQVGGPGGVEQQLLTRTTDGGRSWSRPSLVATDPTAAVDFAHLVWLADGTVVDIYDQTSVTFNLDLASPVPLPGQGSVAAQTMVTRSIDGGATWSPPVQVDRHVFTRINAKDGILIDYTRSVSATDGRGRLVVLSQSQGAGRQLLLLTSSADSGRTWGPTTTFRSQHELLVEPSLTVDHNGRCVVSAYQLDATNPAAPRVARVQLRTSGAPVTVGSDFSLGRTLTPDRSRYFLGDYVGASSGTAGTLLAFPAAAAGRIGTAIFLANLPSS